MSVDHAETLLKLDINKPETLGQRQEKFSEMVMLLLIMAHEMGYRVRLGHAMRCASCRAGHKDSLHKLKLAIDINLFKDGKFLTATEDHRQLGEYWEGLGGSWGGRFFDGNHYSLEWQGMK